MNTPQVDRAKAVSTYFRQLAQKEPDFDSIRDDPHFKALVGGQE
jgi:hypothetical protein